MKGGKKGAKSDKGKKKKEPKKKSAEPQSPFTTYVSQLPPPVPGQKLLEALTTHHVDEKELYGIKVTTRALEKLTPQEIKDLYSMFETFDVHSKSYLGPVEVKKVLHCLGFKVSREIVRKLLHDFGLSGTGFINFNEFLDIIIDLQGDSRDIYEEIKHGFELFDYDKTGKLSWENINRACQEADVKFTKQELDEMFEEADLNGDGFVDLEEFTKIMQLTNLFN